MTEPLPLVKGHVMLIGFMCSGKSRVGREVAPLLHLPFVDLDRVIELRTGPLVPFFKDQGEAAFRKVEKEVLVDLLKGPNSVIAMGGGTPCEGRNMDRMNAAGTTVWLDVPLEDLMPRIERTGGDRPLLFGLKGAALRDRVNELLAPRIPCYARAHLNVKAGAAPEVVADRIRLGLVGYQSI